MKFRLGRLGMGWGFHCLCWPWSRAFEWSCSPREGNIWIFLCPTWRYLTADSDEKDWDRIYTSHFHASRMCRTVWKDLEIMKANENIWPEWFARGQGIWLQIFEKCQIPTPRPVFPPPPSPARWLYTDRCIMLKWPGKPETIVLCWILIEWLGEPAVWRL